MAGGVIEGSATKLLTTALSRFGSSIFQRITRLHKIDGVLRGERLKNRSLETALRDYETVVGSYHGELTEELDRFLRELECTGLLTVMADEAVLGKRHPATKEAFLILHKHVFGRAQKAAE